VHLALEAYQAAQEDGEKQGDKIELGKFRHSPSVTLWAMKFHWKVLAWMLAGVVLGMVLQKGTSAPSFAGAKWGAVADGQGLSILGASGPVGARIQKSDLAVGDVIVAALRNKGSKNPDRPEERVVLRTESDFQGVLDRSQNGDVLFLERADGQTFIVTLGMDPDSSRAAWIRPFDFIADIFMALLKMLIVPIVLTSIISGVAGVGDLGSLRRMGLKTFAYYLSTSLLAIFVGQALVTLIRPGDGAQLGLAMLAPGEAPSGDFIGVLKRMVPANVFDAFGDNSEMLGVIFFALLFGFFITRTDEPHRGKVTGFFQSAFAVMLRMAEGVLTLLPLGVFCLMVRVVSKTGFAVFEPLLLYMGTVTLALLIHACVTLPLVVRFIGRASPKRWAQAMSPALMTAFSTSSSSMTLPVTLETVEKRGKVSNKVTSFTLPLGATINMDGTALYECIGVIFLAQYYSGISPEFSLTFGQQGIVVIMALLASIGAAGIPSAGLVMMLAILSVLGLPIEGAALLLAVDRPLDMLRTVVNVWSDSCGACVIARSEGEEGPLHAGAPG
jgi:Na+/H+-dicarboxylate symporter